MHIYLSVLFKFFVRQRTIREHSVISITNVATYLRNLRGWVIRTSLFHKLYGY